MPAGHLDGVLVGVGAAEREEHLVDVARQELSQLLAQTGAHLGGQERADVRQAFGLRLDRLDDPAVAVAGVDGHQLAVEVDETPAVDGREAHALGARHRHRLEARLCGPVVERVAEAQLGDLLSTESLDGLGHHCV